MTYLAMVRAARRASGSRQSPWRGLWLQIMLDLAVLTVVVHYLGSLETFAPFMYLFHIVLACIFFPSPQSLLVTLSAMGMYLACILAGKPGRGPVRSVLAGSLTPGPDVCPWRSWRGNSARWCSFPARCGILPPGWPARCGGATRIGRHQPPAGGRHGGAGAAHAPHDAPVEGAFCGHPRQRPTLAGRLLRADPGSRPPP